MANKVLRTVAPTSHAPAGQATTVDHIPDELLEQIFLPLSSPVCLVRAACTCKRWCRIVAAASFLRLYRSLHTLTVGYYSTADLFYCGHQYQYDWCPQIDDLVFVPSGSSLVVINRDRFLLMTSHMCPCVATRTHT